MLSILDIVIGAFLSYYWTGLGMVEFHSQLQPIYRPGYVNSSIFKRFVSGLIWPVVTKANKELSWFFVSFLGGLIVFSFFHAISYPYFGSSALVVVVISILRVIPIVSGVVNTPLALVSLVLWFVLAKPFGVKVPKSIERTYQ